VKTSLLQKKIQHDKEYVDCELQETYFFDFSQSEQDFQIEILIHLYFLGYVDVKNPTLGKRSIRTYQKIG